MAWNWKIQRAAVEQEILFPAKEVYDSYVGKLEKSGEPFEVVSKKQNQDGSITAVMRKRYNNNLFLRNDEKL